MVSKNIYLEIACSTSYVSSKISQTYNSPAGWVISCGGSSVANPSMHITQENRCAQQGWTWGPAIRNRKNQLHEINPCTWMQLYSTVRDCFFPHTGFISTSGPQRFQIGPLDVRSLFFLSSFRWFIDMYACDGMQWTWMRFEHYLVRQHPLNARALRTLEASATHQGSNENRWTRTDFKMRIQYFKSLETSRLELTKSVIISPSAGVWSTARAEKV